MKIEALESTAFQRRLRGLSQAMGVRPQLDAPCETDATNTPNVAVIGENLARTWPGQDAIGKLINTSDPASLWRQVVGVVAPVLGPLMSGAPQYFAPLSQTGGWVALWSEKLRHRERQPQSERRRRRRFESRRFLYQSCRIWFKTLSQSGTSCLSCSRSLAQRRWFSRHSASAYCRLLLPAAFGKSAFEWHLERRVSIATLISDGIRLA